MLGIKVQIVNFINDHNPGFVECVFIDALNNKHVIHEKVPVVTKDNLDSKSTYPQSGIVACELIKEWEDKTGRKIYSVNTEKPWAIESLVGKVEFDVLPTQVINF